MCRPSTLSPQVFHVFMQSWLFRGAGVALLCWSTSAPGAEDAARGLITPAPEFPASLPWDLAALSGPPAFEWLDDAEPVRSLLYAGEPSQGHATRVFAYYATPASIGGGGGPEDNARRDHGH
jgi:hypothetical protein